MIINNDKDTFVQLWQELERTRGRLESQGKRFCVRHVLTDWYKQGLIDWHGTLLEIEDYRPMQATSLDEYIWDVCRICAVEGLTILPPPALSLDRHRELLRVITAKQLKTGLRNIKMKALDLAHKQVFRQK